MRGNATLLSNFIEGNKTQFIIPVYQRNYDWLIENCDQLYNDLVKLSRSARPTHFFGSVVTTTADGYGYNRLIIDGQQRVTTISLLLLAGIKAVREGKLSVSNEERLNEAYELFLKAKFSSSARKIKLVPIENDLIAYDKIFNDELELTEGSKMTRNFQYFYGKLTEAASTFTFDNLLDSIERLQIISIELDGNDDAQLIFESLNSTGLALTEADKVRNFLLMSLSAEEQQYCFKNYWQKIEVATGNNPTMFLRDYLTIIQSLQRPVRINNLYFEWKKYMADNDRKEELKKMLVYADYYHQITTSRLTTDKLSNKMRHIYNIETDVANVFFIQFLKYAQDNGLNEEVVYNVIDIIENYMARRIVCNLPANALTQVFCALHKDVLKSIEEYEKANVDMRWNYADILTYHILRRDGNYQLPKDPVFEESLLTRDAYHMMKPYQIFLFERLENAVRGEYNDVATDMKTKDATIEHIMPQTLNSDWISMLGANHDEIQEKYLHTFANLTLTGINSELSNKAFKIKRDGTLTADEVNPGYKDSKYRITRSVTNCDKWTEQEMEERGKEIVKAFMRLYPMPTTTFKPVPKPMDEVSLDDESFNPTSRILKGFRLFGKEYVEDTWKNMLIRVINITAERYPDDVDALYDTGGFFWTSRKADIQYCTQVAPDRYVWTSMDNRNKIRCLRYLFERCDISQSELVLLLDFTKGEE